MVIRLSILVGKRSTPFLWLFPGILILVLLAGCIIPQQQAGQPDRQSTVPPTTEQISHFTTVSTSTPRPVDGTHSLPLTGTIWTLEAYLGDNSTMVPAIVTVTARFSAINGTIGGHSGCNHYGYSYNLSGENGISTKPIFSTLIFCYSPWGTTEDSYRYHLRNASSYETTPDGLLNIRDASGTVILVFSGQEMPPEQPAVPGPTRTYPIIPASHGSLNETQFVYDLEREIFSQTNLERSSRGVPPLIWDDRLALLARDYSEDMVRTGHFGGNNSKGEDLAARASPYGYPLPKKVNGIWYPGDIAENLAPMAAGEFELSCPNEVIVVPDTVSGMASGLVDFWMNHNSCILDENRKNILNPNATHTGVGVAYNGQYYLATQDFW